MSIDRRKLGPFGICLSSYLITLWPNVKFCGNSSHDDINGPTAPKTTEIPAKTTVFQQSSPTTEYCIEKMKHFRDFQRGNWVI